MERSFMKKTMNIFFCALLGAAVLIGGCSDNNKAEAVKEQKTAAAAQKDASLSGARNTPIVAAAKKVGPAVVGITNKAYVRDIFNRVQLTERGTGSGVIYDKSGLIATNNHVVEGASEIIVSLTDGRSVKGKVLGADAATDLAVVKIDENNLPVADFGDSSTLQVGEPAIAIGNPLGLEFRGSVPAGVISALNRSIQLGERKFDLIQTDAAINPGNSGGALVNMYGQVIGINSSKIAQGYEGIGFAIPINSAKEIVDKLIANGYVPGRPKLGVTYYAANQQSSYRMIVQLKELPAGTLVIKSINSDSDLANTDARAGDMIIAVNGKDLDNSNTLLELIEKSKVGDTLTLTLCRIDSNYKTTKFDVKVKLVEDKGSTSSNEPTENATTNTYFNPFGF